MPDPNEPAVINRYYPKISSLITTDDIPDILGFIKDGVTNLFDRIYFKDLQFSKSSKGDAAFYSLSIVSKRIDIEIPGTGIFLVLNPDMQDDGISAFPITIEYQWRILEYLRYFSLGNFSLNPQQIFETVLYILNISEEKALVLFLENFVKPENQNTTFLQQFVKDINDANILNVPLNPPTTSTTISDIVDEIFDKSNGQYSSLIAFTVYLFSSDNDISFIRLRKYFRSILPRDIDEFIKEVHHGSI